MSEQELDRYWKTVVNTIQDGIMIVSTLRHHCIRKPGF